MKNFIDSNLKNELMEIYDRAKAKETETMYSSLKEELKTYLENDSDGSKLESYKMICENASFIEFNINVAAIIISIGGLVIDSSTSCCFASILAIAAILITAIVAIKMHLREQKYKYILYVLNTLPKEKD